MVGLIEKEPDMSKCIEYDEYLYAFVKTNPEAEINLGYEDLTYVDPSMVSMIRINRDYSKVIGVFDAELFKNLLEIGAKICESKDGEAAICYYDNMEVQILKREMEPEHRKPPELKKIPFLMNFPVSFIRVLIEDDIEASGFYYDPKENGIWILRKLNYDPHEADKPHNLKYFVDKATLSRYGIEIKEQESKVLYFTGKEYFRRLYNLYKTAGISHIDMYLLRETENGVLYVVGGQIEMWIAPWILETLENFVEGTDLVLPKVIKYKVPKRKAVKVSRKKRKKKEKVVEVEEVEEEVKLDTPPTRDEVLKYLNSIEGTPEEKLRLLPPAYRSVLDDLIKDNVDSIVTTIKPPWYYKGTEYRTERDLYNIILNAYLLGEDVSRVIKEIIEETESRAKEEIAKEEIPPKAELPPEVKYFIEYNKLEVVGDIIPMEGVRGYDKDKKVYVFDVRDTVTGDIYTAYIPFPSNMEYYSIVSVANKEGKPVNIVTSKEESKEKSMKKPKESIRHVVEKKKSRRVPVMVELRSDKTYIKSLLNKIDNWLATVQSGINKKDKRLVYMYLKDIYDFVMDLFNISRSQIPVVGKMGIKKKVDYSNPLIAKNYDYFCKLMSAYGYDCESFKDRFEMIADPDLDEDTFMYAVENLVEDIHREMLNRMNMIVVEEIKPTKKKERISLKLVNMGVSNVRVKVNMMYGAVNDGNLIELLQLLIDTKETLEKLIRYMERDPEIQAFRNMREKGGM